PALPLLGCCAWCWTPPPPQPPPPHRRYRYRHSLLSWRTGGSTIHRLLLRPAGLAPPRPLPRRQPLTSSPPSPPRCYPRPCCCCCGRKREPPPRCCCGRRRKPVPHLPPPLQTCGKGRTRGNPRR
ncbi:unnamed protein product, partial [Ectocarpus sp. 8 AP-2014]